ncbi:MAG: acylphosphatase [Rickettsiales bacterium]|nr:acylphosphatase [Rickettsiales bacterium]
MLRVLISGRVQGVGFRAWTVREATHLGLRGWVRNLSDGRVEATFAGEETVIHQMIEACKQGPEAARVDAIEVFTTKEDIADEPFAARHTV